MNQICQKNKILTKNSHDAKQLKVWDSLVNIRIKLQETLKLTYAFPLTEDLSKTETKIFFPLIKKMKIVQNKLWLILSSNKTITNQVFWGISLHTINEMMNYWKKKVKLFTQKKQLGSTSTSETFTNEMNIILNETYVTFLKQSRIKEPAKLFQNKIRIKHLVERQANIQVYNDVSFYQSFLRDYLQEKQKNILKRNNFIHFKRNKIKKKKSDDF